jgi:hypothetical protein
MRVVIYGGGASAGGIFNDSLYSEAGADARGYWSIREDTVVAAHMSIRYLPNTRRPLPFWALSSIGGDTSDVGGGQPLRGYGAGRFVDRDEFSANAEAIARPSVVGYVDVGYGHEGAAVFTGLNYPF